MSKALQELVSKSFKTLDALLDSADPKIQLNAVKETLDYEYKLLRLEYSSYETEVDRMSESEEEKAKQEYDEWREEWQEKYGGKLTEWRMRNK